MAQIADAVRNAFRGRNNQADPDEPTIGTDLRRTSFFLGSIAAIGIFGLSVWAYTRNTDARLLAFSLGLLLSGGAALVGGVLGLLFGIPKSVSDPTPAPPTAGNAGSSAAESDSASAKEANAASRPTYSVNTNLEQISDWLTKIIVGVGLVQIGEIRDQFKNLATYFGDGFATGGATPESAAPVVAAVILVYGLTAGFLAGYLLTRMFLPGAFIRADNVFRQNTRLRARIAEVEEVTEDAARQQGQIYTDLYRFEDQGFREAIRKIEDLLKSRANRRNPALWTYLAAAHGQAYEWEQKYGTANANTESLLRQHRDEALHAVRSVLDMGDAWKPILQLMWNKEDPAKKGSAKSEENDLEVFYDDEAFKKLLGK